MDFSSIKLKKAKIKEKSINEVIKEEIENYKNKYEPENKFVKIPSDDEKHWNNIKELLKEDITNYDDLDVK
jgi:hypothetical protein